MASHQLSANAAQADASSADAIAATPADDAASSADAIAATLTAAKTGDLAALAAASDQNLRAVDAYGSNALHWAAGRGHLALVRHLVADRGMDASFPANPPRRRDAPTTRGRTALHYAARNGHLDVVEYLVATARRRRGRARRGRRRRAARVLAQRVRGGRAPVAAGVDVAQKNDAGCGFARWLACAPRDAGDLRPLAAWLAARLGPAALAVEPNGHGHTCLHKAAFAGHFDLCAYLVSCFRGVLLFSSCCRRRALSAVVASTAC